MKLIVDENESKQIFNCMKHIANKNGYEIVDSFIYESGYEESLSISLYKKYSWITKMLYKKPICRFYYSDCIMYIYSTKDHWNYHEVLNLVMDLFKNVEGLTIKIDNDFKYCN